MQPSAPECLQLGWTPARRPTAAAPSRLGGRRSAPSLGPSRRDSAADPRGDEIRQRMAVVVLVARAAGAGSLRRRAGVGLGRTESSSSGVLLPGAAETLHRVRRGRATRRDLPPRRAVRRRSVSAAVRFHRMAARRGKPGGVVRRRRSPARTEWSACGDDEEATGRTAGRPLATRRRRPVVGRNDRNRRSQAESRQGGVSRR